jgi:hypothetical protein
MQSVPSQSSDPFSNVVKRLVPLGWKPFGADVFVEEELDRLGTAGASLGSSARKRAQPRVDTDDFYVVPSPFEPEREKRGPAMLPGIVYIMQKLRVLCST